MGVPEESLYLSLQTALSTLENSFLNMNMSTPQLWVDIDVDADWQFGFVENRWSSEPRISLCLCRCSLWMARSPSNKFQVCLVKNCCFRSHELYPSHECSKPRKYLPPLFLCLFFLSAVFVSIFFLSIFFPPMFFRSLFSLDIILEENLHKMLICCFFWHKTIEWRKRDHVAQESRQKCWFDASFGKEASFWKRISRRKKKLVRC